MTRSLPRALRRALPRVVAVWLLVGIFATACGSDNPSDDYAFPPEPSAPTPPADSLPPGESTPPEEEATSLIRSRFVPDDYVGKAWPVPETPLAGDLVNSIEVQLVDADGTDQGTDHIPTGTAVEIRPTDVAGRVALDWSDGLTATASQSDFWIIGDFAEFKDIEFELYGVNVRAVDTRLLYHRVGPGNFDDPDTPEFEGIANNIRKYLNCTEDRWKIANQYFAIDIVADGIYANDPELVAEGVTSLNWGISQDLAEDGVFSLYRECDGTTARDYSETHHSTQWFAALGRGVFQLAASQFAGEYRAEIDAYIEHLETLATYLTTDSVRDHWIDRWLFEDNGNFFNHKFYMRAAGLALVSALTDNPVDAERWALEAQAWAEDGMSRQTEEGVNPERGGPDVRYQMYGTWLGIVYRSMLEDSQQRDDMTNMINKSIAWIDPKLDPETGVIDITGSTRSCTPNSNPLEYHPYHMVSVYVMWAYSEPGNERLFDRALLASDGQRSGGNTCPQN